MAKLDNYMVLDFDTIRPILKYISVYGCYTAKQIAEEFDITEYQYKENLLRVFYSLQQFPRFTQHNLAYLPVYLGNLRIHQHFLAF